MDRGQFVTIDRFDSSTNHYKYGVSQGSILGPLLFKIYINDLPQIPNLASFILYAGEASIISTGANITDVNQ